MKPGKHGERGQTLPIVGISLLLLFGFAALAVDAGYLEYKQRAQQTAADAAAIAGAWALFNGTNVNSAAQSSAGTNGFTNNGTTVVVKATTPPATGFNTANSNAVEATVTVTYPAILSAIWRSSNTVSTRAVAVVQSNPNGGCFWVLQKDLTNNGGVINAPCSILVERDVHVGTANVPSIGAGGKVDGNATNGTTVVTQGIPTPILDPCLDGTIHGCKAIVNMYPFGSTPGAGPGTPYSSCATSPPVSGTSITGGCYPSMSGSFNLAPGLYVIQGDFSASLTCTSCVLGSTGVTLVVGGKVNLNGSTTAINAPPAVTGVQSATVTAAGAPGVLFYQTSTNTNPENFSAQSLLGLIYVPGAHVNFNGGGSTETITSIVAADIVANNATLSVSGTSSSGYATQVPVLSE